MIAFLFGVAVGAVASYLVLRNNPRVRGELDRVTDRVEQRLDK